MKQNDSNHPSSDSSEQENKGVESIKYFDETNYNTIIVQNEAEESNKPKSSVKRNSSFDLIELIKENKTELLKSLKENKGKKILLEAISTPEYQAYLSQIVALCWETGLDFSKESQLFFDLAGHSDVYVSLEALTVLENLVSFPSIQELETGLDKLKDIVKNKHSNSAMVEEIRLTLFERLKDLKSN